MIVAIFMVSFGFGHWYGELDTPAYATKAGAVSYFLAHVREEELKPSGGRIFVVDAYPYWYVYKPSTHKVRKILQPGARADSDSRSFVRQRSNIFEMHRASDYFALGALPASSSLLGALADNAGMKVAGRVARYGLFAVATATFVTGGAVGYYNAYSDPRDYENPTFVDTLLNENLWQSVAELAQSCELLDAAVALDPATTRNAKRGETIKFGDLNVDAAEILDAGERANLSLKQGKLGCLRFKVWLEANLVTSNFGYSTPVKLLDEADR